MRADGEGEGDGEATMTGFEHLEEYVRGITGAKIEALKKNGGQLPTREVRMVDAAAAAVADGSEDVDREELVLVGGEQMGGFEGVDGDEEDE